jgi:hypothetical protein
MHLLAQVKAHPSPEQEPPQSTLRSTRKLRFQGVLDGVALLANNSGNPFTEDISFTVQVIPSGLEK